MTTTTQRALTIAALALCALVGFAAPASAQSMPEAFIGTFMPHGLDGRDYVDSHIDLFRDAMQGCYEDELDSSPDVAGLMLMRVYIEANGAISDVDIVQNRTGSSELATCVESNIEQAQLSPNNRNNVSITLPVTFRMRDAGTELARR